LTESNPSVFDEMDTGEHEQT